VEPRVFEKTQAKAKAGPEEFSIETEYALAITWVNKKRQKKAKTI